ncbi:MAG: holo-ACP synthase [Helicobacteraceae bacterium]|jgi:holo-[acyl-carrier protein] synthase|nr:holo-ACP synthase [Helicobacteraceae bacterium]
MIGVDIVSIERIEALIKRFGDRGLARFLNESEIALCGGRAQSIAGFWAAKEAIAKALGCGIGSQLSFREITIEKNKFGAPSVNLSRRAMGVFRVERVAISITHEKTFAIAAAFVKFH